MRKNVRFRKRYFLKLFLIIFVLALFTISIALYAIYYIYGTKASEEQQNYIADSLSAADKMFFTTLSEVDMLYTLAWTNDKVQGFLRSAQPSAALREQTDAFLRSLHSLNAYVESIAVYNHQAQQYLYSGPNHVDMQTFLSTYLNDLSRRGDSNLSKQKELFLFTPGGSLPESDRKGDSMISVVYYEIEPGGNRHNCIAINLDTALVAGNLLMGIGDTGMMMNEYGTIICATGTPEAPLKNRMDWSRRVTGETRRAGHFSDVIRGEDKIVSYHGLTEGSWTLYHISDDTRLNLFSTRTLGWLPLLLTLSIAFSTALAFVFSTRLYSPLNRIVSRFDDDPASAAGPWSHDEFALVNAMFARLSNQITSLESENTCHLTNAKREYLRHILDGDSEQDLMEEDWSAYNLAVVPENLIVVVIKQDGADSDAPSGCAFEDLLREGATLCLGQDNTMELVSKKRDEVALLLNPFSEGDLSWETLCAQLEQLQTLIGAPTQVSIGIGGVANTAEECAACYRTATELLKQRFVLGYGRIITVELVERKLSHGLRYPEDLVNELESNIREANKPLFMENYARLLDIFSKYVYQDVISVLLQVITRCMYVMNSVSIDNNMLKVDFDEFNEIFSTVYTLDHTRAWFSRMFDEYLQAIRNLEQLKGDRYHQIAERIQQYVELYYHDVNLSVERIAEQLNYTPSYVSKIYRNLTGSYLKDYIKRVRIKHAKRLLETTGSTIHEISDMSGFANYNYFFHSFKKETGLTPTAYKNRHLARAEQAGMSGDGD